MAETQLNFICLDPRKSKRSKIERTLSPLGTIRWLRSVPMRRRDYLEAAKRAETAFETATRKPNGPLATAAKKHLLKKQYNGARALFEKERDAIAVAWNGLNGSRRVFIDAARDAGARTLFFELCPFPGRITVDPCGVNFANGLPRDVGPFLAWAETNKMSDQWRAARASIKARATKAPPDKNGPDKPLSDNFIFVPLQVPGDSQLRIFGGAYRTVEQVIKAVSEAARRLPDGWHVRVKEHPTSPIRFGSLLEAEKHPKLVVDNATDTFHQVAACHAVVTVNSSVGLEAMFYDKPVVALGDCFWALPGVAQHCDTPEALCSLLSDPHQIVFDGMARSAFLNYLISVYYPDLGRCEDNGDLHNQEVAKVRARLTGPDQYGFWGMKETI